VNANNWWSVPREENLDYFSYVASSEGNASVEELKEKAFMTAASIIVREHFGITIESSESVLEETNHSKYQFLTKIKSSPMIIKGLKLTDIKIMNIGTLIRVFVRVMISKKDLDNAVNDQKKSQVENIYGEGKGEHFVFVKTIPQGSFIQITGIDKRYIVQGHGDAKFYLPPGEYNILINEKGHEHIHSKVKISDKDEELKYELKPILGKLNISIHPEDAIISPLNDVKGENPFYLIPNQKYRFKVSHPDYFEQEFEFLIEDDREFTKEISLQRRSSSLRFHISPEPYLFTINNKFYQNGERISLDEEEIYIIIEARGHKRYEKKMKLNPNRFYPDEFIKLVPLSDTGNLKLPVVLITKI
jgi:DNA-directed RNA polymerase subunit H (RpoH/RPB5)